MDENIEEALLLRHTILQMVVQRMFQLGGIWSLVFENAEAKILRAIRQSSDAISQKSLSRCRP